MLLLDRSYTIQCAQHPLWHNSQENQPDKLTLIRSLLQTHQIVLNTHRSWLDPQIWNDDQPNPPSGDVDSRTTWQEEFAINVNAYETFLKTNIHNSSYRDKYLVFIHGILCGSSESKIDLKKKIRKQYGNIDMYIGHVSDNQPIYEVLSPLAY